MTKTNQVKKILLSVLMLVMTLCMAIGIFASNPITAQAATYSYAEAGITTKTVTFINDGVSAAGYTNSVIDLYNFAGQNVMQGTNGLFHSGVSADGKNYYYGNSLSKYQWDFKKASTAVIWGYYQFSATVPVYNDRVFYLVVDNNGNYVNSGAVVIGSDNTVHANEFTNAQLDYKLYVSVGTAAQNFSFDSSGRLYLNSRFGGYNTFYLTPNGITTNSNNSSIIKPSTPIAAPNVPGAVTSNNSIYTLTTAYTGNNQTPFPTNMTGVTWSGTTSATNAGQYTAYATPKSGYTWADGTTTSKIYVWTINALASTSGNTSVTLSSLLYDYTGTAITPKPTVKINSVQLTEGVDYTLSYSSNTEPGIGTVTVTFKGNYSGASSANFVINQSAASVNGVKYTTLQEAIDAAGNGETVTLLKNVNTAISVPAGKNIVLDLKGNSITTESGGAITNNGTLTVKDSVGSGKIEGPAGISNFNTLTVESGTIIGTSTDGICNNYGATSLTVTGGTIKGAQLAICDYATSGTGTLSNCTLECTGTTVGAGRGYVLGSYDSGIGGSWTINEGVVLKNNNYSANLVNTNTETGIAGAGQVTVANWETIKDSMIAIGGQIVVGAKVIVEIDGVQTAFTSMEEAIAVAASANSATIKLLADYDKAITIPENANVTIDLNGHNITTNGTTITNNGTLTIVNSSDIPATVQGGNYCVSNSGELNINGDSVSDITIFSTGNNDAIGNESGGTIHIDGATVKSNGYYAILDQGGKTGNTIANAHLECGSDGNGGAFALGGYNGNGGEWTISEGVTMKNGDTAKPADQLINTSNLGYDTPVTIANGDEIAIADADGDRVYTVVEAVAKVTFADGTSKTYATLEEAIAACPEDAAATVEILTNTTINDTITIPASKNITITGNATVLGNAADKPMFKVEDGATLTVGGNVTLNAQNKGGIIETSGDVTVAGNASLINGKATNGGAISVANGGSVTVKDNATLKNNSASGNGGAIYVAEGGSATVSGGTFDTNSATNGGAIYYAAGTNAKDPTISGGTFKGNAASGNGGAVYVGTGLTATVTGGTMTNNGAAMGEGIYLDVATLNLDGTSATAGITDTIGMNHTVNALGNGDTSIINITSDTIDHKVYVEFENPDNLFNSQKEVVTADSDNLTPEDLKSSFRCSNKNITFDGTSSENGLILGHSNEEYVVWFDKDGKAHAYSDINKALEDMLVAQQNGTLGDDNTLYFVQYQNDANSDLNRTVIELDEAIVIPDGLNVKFDSAVKHTDNSGENFTYEKGTEAGVSPTVVTRTNNYLGELVRVEADSDKDGNDATLTIENLTLDGGAVWGEDGKIEIKDDGKGTAGSVTNNNTGISASAPVIVNGGNLTLGDKATIQNNDNYYGQAGTGFGSQYYGGGIRNEGAGEFTMNAGSTITGCYAREGGAILNINKPGVEGVYVENGNPTVTINGGTITDNASQQKGAAIQTIYGGATTTVSGGTITDNFSLNDLGTLAVEEGGSLTVNGGTISAGSGTVLGEATETQNDNAIYIYNKYGDDDYAGAVNKPFIEGKGEADVTITNNPTITGAVFLDNPCVVYDSNTEYAPIIDATGFTGTGSGENGKLEIKIEEDRAFGEGVVIVNSASANKVTITLPTEIKDKYQYVEQERVTDAITGVMSYSGYALNITQTESGKLDIFGVCDTGADEIVISLNGDTYTLVPENGVIKGQITPTNGNSWETITITVNQSDTELVSGTLDQNQNKVGMVTVNQDGTISAPDGTKYTNISGTSAAMIDGDLPNDVKIDENGNAIFNVNGKELQIYIGCREDAPMASDGKIVDFDNDSASVAVQVQAGLQYAIVDTSGNVVKGWNTADANGTITFDGLTQGTAYQVVTRVPAGSNTLPSVYTDIANFTTLTDAEAEDKVLFEEAATEFDNEKSFDKAIAVLEAYQVLTDGVKKLESVNAAVRSALSVAKSELQSDVSKAVNTAKENTPDEAMKARLDAVNTYYTAEINNLTNVENCDEAIALLKAKADAEIALIGEYATLASTHKDDMLSTDGISSVLNTTIGDVRADENSADVTDTKDAGIDAIKVAIAQEMLNTYYSTEVAPFLADRFCVTSDEQKQRVEEAYADILKDIKTAITDGKSIEAAFADAEVKLYAEATMAGLRDLAADIVSIEASGAIETAIQEIATKDTIDEIDSEKATIALAIQKQLAKEAIKEAAGSNPSNSVQTIVNTYNAENTGKIDSQTTKEAVELEKARAIAKIKLEQARSELTEEIGGNDKGADKNTKLEALDAVINEAISALDTTDFADIAGVRDNAVADAKEAVANLDKAVLTGGTHGAIINKDTSAITKEDLDAINAALAELETYTATTQDELDEVRNDLLDKKEAAILDSLNSLKENGNTAVNDIVDKYIAELDNVNADGNTAEDKVASETLDDIFDNAENEVATKKYQQDAVAQITGTADAADNDAVDQAIADAIADINAVEFDVTKSEAENKAAIDAVLNAAIAEINNARAEQYKAAIDGYLGADSATNVTTEATNGKTAIANAATTANGNNTLLSADTFKGLVATAELEMDKERAKNTIVGAAGSTPTTAIQTIVNAYNTATSGTIDSQTTKEAVELETARAIAKIELEQARERIAAEINAQASDPNKNGKLAELNEIIDNAIEALDGSEATDETKINQIKTNAISNAEDAVAEFDRDTFEAQYTDILNKDNATITASDMANIDAALDTLGTYIASAQSAMDDLRNNLLEKKKLATVDSLNTLKAENSGNTAVEAIIDGYIADVNDILVNGDTAADATANDNLDAIITNAPKAVEFELYKQGVAADLNSYKEATDEQAVTTAIDNAIAEINGIAYDANSDLGALKSAVDAEKAEQIALISTARKDQYKADIVEYLGADSAVSNVNTEATSGKNNIDAATNGNEPVTGSALQAIVDAAKLEMDKERAKNAIIEAAGTDENGNIDNIVAEYTANDGTIEEQTSLAAIEFERDRAIAKIELEQARAELTEEIGGNNNGADKQDKIDALDAVINEAISALDTTASADIAGVVDTAVADAKEAVAELDKAALTGGTHGAIINKDKSNITKDDLDAINAALAELETYTATTQDELDEVRNDLLDKKKAAILDALNDLKTDNATVAGVSGIVDGYIAELGNIDSTGNTAADKTASDALTEVLADAENEVAMQIAREQAKAEINGYVDNVNDSSDVKQAITNAVTNIDNVPFDADKTEEQNKKAIEDAKNAAITAINNARVEQYKAVIDEYLGTDSATNVKAEATNGKTAIESALAEANGNNEILDVAELKGLVATAELEMDKERAKNTIVGATGSTPTINVQAIVEAYNTTATGNIDKQTTKADVELALNKALAQISVEAIREEITANIDPDYENADKLGAEADIDAVVEAEIAKIATATTKPDLDKIVEDARKSAEKALADYDYNKITNIHSGIIGKTEIEAGDLAAIDAALEDIAVLKDATKEKAYFEELRNELLDKKKDAIIAGLEAQKDGSDNVDAMVDTYIEKIEAIVTTGDAEADETASATLDTLMEKANDGIAFEEYKNDKIEEIGNLKEADDTSYVETIIKAEQDRIETLTFDETATLGSQTAEVDTIVSGVPAQLELQRFKDDAVAEYKESYEAITGSALADDTAIYDKLGTETTKTAVNEKLGEEIKALVQSLENAKDSDTTKGYIDTVVNAIDNAIATANGSDADLSSVLNVTVGTTPTDIKTAVEEQRATEKAAAKGEVLDDVIATFGQDYTAIPEAVTIINNANAAIDAGDYTDYAGIVADAKDTVDLLKGVEDYKQELKDKLDDIAGTSDSQAVTDLIAAAKDAVENVAFDASKSLDDHKTALDAVCNPLEEGIYDQRIDDYKAAVDALVGEADGENVKNAADEAKAEMDALVKPTEEQIKELLEDAKADIATEKFKDGQSGDDDVLRKDFDDIAADDIPAIEAAIEEYGKLDDTTKDYIDSTVETPYSSYLDELEDRLAAAEFAKAKEEAIAEIEAFLRGHDGEFVKDINKAETDKIAGMTYTPQAAADREAYVASLNDSVAKAEEAGIIATEQAQSGQIAINNAKEDNTDRKASGQYNDEQKAQLDAIMDAFQDKVESLPSATTEEKLAENKEQIEAWLEEAKAEMAETPIVAVTNGNIDLNNQDDAEYDETEDDENANPVVWGIVTNDSSMPGSIQLIIEKIDEEKAAAVEDAVKNNTLIVAGGSNLTQEQLKELVAGKEVATALDIYLLKKNAKITEFEGVYTVKLLLTPEQRGMNGAQVIFVKDNGEIEVFETKTEDGKYLVFSTTHFSEFYILETPDVNLWWLIITLSAVLLSELAEIAVVANKKKKAKKNEVNTYSVAPMALLSAIIVPVGGVWISIALGVLVLAAAAVLVVMLIKMPKKTAKEADETVVLVAVANEDVAAEETAPVLPSEEEQDDSTNAPVASVTPPRERVTVAEASELMTNEEATAMLLPDADKYGVEGRRYAINIDTLSRCFENGDVVNIETLKEKGLVPKKERALKILARGTLDKQLTVEAEDFSIDAVKMIVLVGGTAYKLRIPKN